MTLVSPNTLKTFRDQGVYFKITFKWRSNFKKKNIVGTLGSFVNQLHTWADSVNNLLILGVLGGTSGKQLRVTLVIWIASVD